MIAEEIRKAVSGAAAERTVADVRIGLGYTAVMLDDGGVGVAYTFHGDAGGGCSVFTGSRPNAGQPAQDVLRYLGSADRIECAVGLAVANALTNRPSPGQSEGDILDLLPVRAGDRVGMVGFFGPLVAPLKDGPASCSSSSAIRAVPSGRCRPRRPCARCLGATSP